MKEDIFNAVEKIGETRVRNPTTIFVANGELKSWNEMGSDIDIAYRLYGKYTATVSDKEKLYTTFEKYVDDEITHGNLISTKTFVTDNIEVPEGYDEQKVFDELTGKVNKSLFCGATISQLRTFLQKQQHDLDEGLYGQRATRRFD